MRILITGGAGFIGTNLLHYLVPKYKDDEFTCIDSLNYAGDLDNLDPIMNHPNFGFIKGDITDKTLIEALFKSEGFDLVIHLAAQTHVDRAILNNDDFVRTNILGTQVLLQASLKHSINKFIYVSTDEVYGTNQGKAFDEVSTLYPGNPYAATKAAAEHLCMAYHKTYSLPVVILRPCNNYGAYQHIEKQIPLMIICALRDIPLPEYGVGLYVRERIHVSDCVRAIDLVLRKADAGQVYNISSNEECTNISLCRQILDLMNKPHNLITLIKDRLGHDRRYSIDSTRIKDDLGFNPEVNLREGLKSTIEWYLSNTNWIKKRFNEDFLMFVKKNYEDRCYNYISRAF